MANSTYRLIAFICAHIIATLFCFGLVAIAQDSVTLEQDTNRFGSDYHGFDLDEPNPGLCRTACAEDNRCRAYTYVKPGVQGANARCYLKGVAPEATTDTCCISGIKRSLPAGALPDRSAAIATGGGFSTVLDPAQLYPDGAELYVALSGGFRIDKDTVASPGRSNVVFTWDISKVTRATSDAALWQISTKPFPPFAGDSPATRNPDGLVASGVVHNRRTFAVDAAAAVTEAKRQTKQPTLIFGDGALCQHANCDGFRFIACARSNGEGELISYPEMRGFRLDWCKHAGRECGAPAANLYCLERGYNYAARWAIDPKIGAGAEDQQEWLFYVRFIPLRSAASPTIVAKPSNVMRLFYNFPETTPDFQFYSEDVERVPSPSYELINLRYRADHSFKVPKNCKEPSGGSEPRSIVKAFKKLWNGAINKAYQKAQDAVVKVADRMTFGLVPKRIWNVGLDVAMMYAGIPPDLPNIKDIMSGGLDPRDIAKGALEEAGSAAISNLAAGGVDYLASEMAGEMLKEFPVNSVLPDTGNLFGDALLAEIKEEARDRFDVELQSIIDDPTRSLEDKVRYALEVRTRNALIDSADEFDNLVKSEYKFCHRVRFYPTYFVTVRNTSDRDIPNFTIEAADNGRIFKSKSVDVMLRAGQTMTIPLSPEMELPALPDKYQFVEDNVNEEIGLWINEIYPNRKTKVIIRASGDFVCRDPLGPQTRVCGTEMKTLFVSPQQHLLNADLSLIP